MNLEIKDLVREGVRGKEKRFVGVEERSPFCFKIHGLSKGGCLGQEKGGSYFFCFQDIPARTTFTGTGGIGLGSLIFFRTSGMLIYFFSINSLLAIGCLSGTVAYNPHGAYPGQRKTQGKGEYREKMEYFFSHNTQVLIFMLVLYWLNH